MAANHGEGTLWRGATVKKNIKGYSDAVISHHKNKQQNDYIATSF